MDNRMVTRPGADAQRMGGFNGAEPEENEEEKVYYGFGVFMGLPLADLRAMKEDYLQSRQRGGGAPAPTEMSHPAPKNGNVMGSEPMPVRPADVGAPMRGAPLGAAPPRGPYAEYEIRDPMGRTHSVMRGAMDNGRGMPPVRDLDPRLAGNGGVGGGGGGGGGMGHMPQRHYPAPPPQGRRMEYDASAPTGGHSDDGNSSDGSYSAPKAHSLNFILH